MAVDEQKDGEPADGSSKTANKKKGNLGKLLAIVFGALFLAGISIGATIFFVGGSKKDGAAEEASAADSSDGESAGAEGSADEKGNKGAKKAPIYFAFDPPFVVNFEDQSNVRFLQITVEVMARDPEAIAAIQTHMPIIRNNLIIFFSSQSYETISTREGKEQIRAQALSEIQRVLKDETGKPGIEAAYFTSFVMQ